MTAKQRSRVPEAVTWMLLALLLSSSAARAGQVRLPFSRYRLPDISTVGGSIEGDGMESPVLAGGDGDSGEEEASGTGKKIAGAVVFGSGLLLCSWGIVDWQTGDTQCCPARNTENVAKIVVGVVLVNAGLVYLIAGGL